MLDLPSKPVLLIPSSNIISKPLGSEFSFSCFCADPRHAKAPTRQALALLSALGAFGTRASKEVGRIKVGMLFSFYLLECVVVQKALSVVLWNFTKKRVPASAATVTHRLDA
jgi:hypothetical protein